MSVAALVLAAGGSTRMGRPKQLLPFRGRTLLRHVVEVALQAECHPVIAVLGARADQMVAELDGENVTAVVNRDWAAGPGTSVRAGVTAIEQVPGVEAAVFLLCDQPLVDATHLARLVAAWRETGLPMVASGYGGTLGVPALFARVCLPELLALQPGAGAKQLLNQRPSRVAVVPCPEAEFDLDTPADCERLRTEWAVSQQPEEPRGHRQ